MKFTTLLSRRHRGAAAIAALIALVGSGPSCLPAYSAEDWGGSVQALGGIRNQGDAEPADIQVVGGLEAAFGPLQWPVQVEVGAQYSQDSADKVVSGTRVDFDVTNTEYYAGIRRTWALPLSKNLEETPLHLYLGGGVTFINTDVETAGVSVDDDSPALYVHGGVTWDLTDLLFFGFDARVTELADTFSGPGDFSDNFQGAVVFGLRW
ncbi:MAG: outer membrane beta-barrel protein [Planctomycetota bacterium]